VDCLIWKKATTKYKREAGILDSQLRGFLVIARATRRIVKEVVKVCKRQLVALEDHDMSTFPRASPLKPRESRGMLKESSVSSSRGMFKVPSASSSRGMFKVPSASSSSRGMFKLPSYSSSVDSLA